MERIGARSSAMGLAGRYRIELSSEGIVAVVDGDDCLDVARSLYWHAVMNHPKRLVTLCDRDRVIARSDQLKQRLSATAGTAGGKIFGKV